MPVSTQETRFLLTARDRTKLALRSARLGFKDVGRAVTGVNSRLLALAGIGGLGGVLTGIVNVNSSMQTLKSSLKTVTGSSEAAAVAFSKIQKFAVTTPFDLEQWTQAFIKMKSLGLDPSEAALNSYGNTAAAMGKDLNQMIEAVADASTGEFERLKEFGIKARKEGERISLTFQGTTTAIGNNAVEIEKYLQRIGNNQFGTAMADQMDNLNPAFSNLRQSFSDLSVKIGESGLNDLVLSLTRNTTEFVNSIDDVRMKTFVDFFSGVGDVLGVVSDTIGMITDGYGLLFSLINGPGAIDIGNLTPSVPGYQLGSFNNSGGSLETLKRQQSLSTANPDEAKKTREAMDKNNQYQEQILMAIRNNRNVATAGR